MQRTSLILFILVTVIKSYSQIKFEEGYFIDNSNQKIECLIKNIDWVNNPSYFFYKKDDTDKSKKITVDEVKEFGIYEKLKYVKFLVNIDNSSNLINDLDYSRNPVFEKKTIFLKVVIEGEASLYSYRNRNKKKFFFKKKSLPVEQLIFKKFLSGNKIKNNNSFKNLLWKNLKCKDISYESFEKLKYLEKDLSKLFKKYNECKNEVFLSFKKEKGSINLSLKYSLIKSSLSIQNTLDFSYIDVDFKDKIRSKFGFEVEYIMPFNRNKWSFTLEPTYQKYSSIATTEINPFRLVVPTEIGVSFDYESIEIPLGLKHYFFLNSNSKIFVSSFIIFDTILNNNLTFFSGFSSNDSEAFQVSDNINYGFGFGYKYKNTFSVEFRHFLEKDILNSSVGWNLNYQSSGLIFGYTLF